MKVTVTDNGTRYAITDAQVELDADNENALSCQRIEANLQDSNRWKFGVINAFIDVSGDESVNCDRRRQVADVLRAIANAIEVQAGS